MVLLTGCPDEPVTSDMLPSVSLDLKGYDLNSDVLDLTMPDMATTYQVFCGVEQNNCCTRVELFDLAWKNKCELLSYDYPYIIEYTEPCHPASNERAGYKSLIFACK